MTDYDLLFVSSDDRISGTSSDFTVAISGGRESLENVTHFEIKSLTLPQSNPNIKASVNKMIVGFQSWNISTDTLLATNTTEISIPTPGNYSVAEFLPLIKTAIEGSLATIYPAETEPFTVNVTYSENTSKFSIQVTSVYGRAHNYGSNIVEWFIVNDNDLDTSLYTSGYKKSLNYVMGFEDLTHPSTTIVPFEDATNLYESSTLHGFQGDTEIYLCCDAIKASKTTSLKGGHQVLQTIGVNQNYGEIASLIAGNSATLIPVRSSTINSMRFYILNQDFDFVDLGGGTVNLQIGVYYKT